jgi:hypothetical protein
MMKTSILRAMALGMVLSAACAFGQQRSVQPSPAYNGGTVYYPQAPAVRPVQPQATQPVYYAPPSSQPTLAPPQDTYEEEDEEGIYWFWGQKWPGLALGPKIGTTGIGADVTFGINRFLNLRGGYNYAAFTWSQELDSVDYDMDVDISSLPLLVDIHPFGNHFRITGGFYAMPGASADINATPDSAVQIGEHSYTPDVIGTLSGEIEVAKTFAPYLGLGFGNSVGEEQLLTFMFDLGVIFQSYDVSLTSNGAGMTALHDTFREDLKKEEANMQDDLDSIKIYPVLTFGIAYHF